MMTKRSPQPFQWLLFSVGGMVAALLTPILFLLFGIIFPLGFVTPPDRERLLAVLHHPLIRVVLLGVCVFALFHCTHRFHYVLRDGLRLKHPNPLINVIGYTGAITGSIMAGYILLRT
jgi:fumarate reductase subunit D